MSTFNDLIDKARDAVAVGRVFGEPFEKDGTTFIPAARIAGGGGGGAGTDENGQAGDGGGFGLAGRPVGAYVIRDGEVTWQPAIDGNRVIAAFTVVVVAALIAGAVAGSRSRCGT